VPAADAFHAAGAIDGRADAPLSAGLRVLHVSQPTDAGVAACVLRLVQAQRELGWRVSLACPATGWLAEAAAAAGAQVLLWPARRSPGPWIVREVRRLQRLVAEVDPVLTHLHSSKAGVAGRLALRGRHPCVFQPHGWSFEAVTGATRTATVAWERFGARWADRILCVSEAERWLGVGRGIKGSMRVVHNGVDASVAPCLYGVDRSGARLALGLPPGPMAVCVGRLCRQKGQDQLLRAWPSVIDRVPNAHLYLVGDGPLRPELERWAGPGVVLVGHDPRPTLWYLAANVAVVPSRWEGMALVPLEAMACARAVVAADVVGMVETLPEGAGAIVPAGDPAGLGEAIVDRLQNPQAADAEGLLGRARVVSSFDATSMATKVANLYAETLAEFTRKTSWGRQPFPRYTPDMDGGPA
jgi:glycosyltransferase involved in cell wall biosynthesis